MVNQDCQVCFRIICRGCEWVADDDDVVLIQAGKMIACPECGWSPKGKPNRSNNPIVVR